MEIQNNEPKRKLFQNQDMDSKVPTQPISWQYFFLIALILKIPDFFFYGIINDWLDSAGIILLIIGIVKFFTQMKTPKTKKEALKNIGFGLLWLIIYFIVWGIANSTVSRLRGSS